MVNFSTHWANSADDKLMIVSYFSQKTGSDISLKCLHLRQFAWNVKMHFLGGEKKKNISKCHLL